DSILGSSRSSSELSTKRRLEDMCEMPESSPCFHFYRTLFRGIVEILRGERPATRWPGVVQNLSTDEAVRGREHAKMVGTVDREDPHLRIFPGYICSGSFGGIPGVETRSTGTVAWSPAWTSWAISANCSNSRSSSARPSAV